MSIVVKATYDLADGELALAGRQAPPEGERWVDDDVERALASPSDMTPFKIRGECFVLGRCHPPDAPVARTHVAFKIGPVNKHIAVIGERTWRTLQQPAELLSMPLTWERARRDAQLNPVGAEVPSLEDPQRLIQGPEDRPAPAGCGPLARTWPRPASRRAHPRGERRAPGRRPGQRRARLSLRQPSFAGSDRRGRDSAVSASRSWAMEAARARRCRPGSPSKKSQDAAALWRSVPSR